VNTVDDAARRNFLATLGNIFIQFQIEQNKKAAADSQAAKPEQSAAAETLAENLQAKGESTTKTKDVKKLADPLETVTSARPELSEYEVNLDAADTDNVAQQDNGLPTLADWLAAQEAAPGDLEEQFRIMNIPEQEKERIRRVISEIEKTMQDFTG
jgi:hypothetical protein